MRRSHLGEARVSDRTRQQASRAKCGVVQGRDEPSRAGRGGAARLDGMRMRPEELGIVSRMEGLGRKDGEARRERKEESMRKERD